MSHKPLHKSAATASSPTKTPCGHPHVAEETIELDPLYPDQDVVEYYTGIFCQDCGQEVRDED